MQHTMRYQSVCGRHRRSDSFRLDVSRSMSNSLDAKCKEATYGLTCFLKKERKRGRNSVSVIHCLSGHKINGN
jgi:hypothetical protein